MSDEKKDPQATQELNSDELGHVSGGLLPAVNQIKSVKLAGDGSVMPTDQVSLNFTKVQKV